MPDYKQYNRISVAVAREVSDTEIELGASSLTDKGISISDEDLLAGSPVKGDMIARNPKNHADKWLIAAQYFADNFEGIK